MNIVLKINEKDKQEISVQLNQQNKQIFSASELDFTVTTGCEYEINEYKISFVPKKDIQMHNITVYIPFSENKIGSCLPFKVFDNSTCTNALPRICMLDRDSEAIESRDIVMAQSKDGNINAAFSTFNRFYTIFHTDSEGIKAIFHLEDKFVHAGEKYELETLAIEEGIDALDFFERYTQTLHERYNIGKMKDIPAGWSSWSCRYFDIDEKTSLRQAELLADGWKNRGADLLQIDDGWQKGKTFGAYWTNDEEAFPHGIAWMSEKCKELGLKLGLWMAPGLVRDYSKRCDELFPYLNRENGELIPNFGGGKTTPDGKHGFIYVLDIGNEKVVQIAKEMFLRAVSEYDVKYFKIDFIVALLYKIGGGGNVQYKEGYSVELYRRYFKEIRRAVGDDTFMLACGSPIGEAVGIFDGIRISGDIAQGGTETTSEAWELISNCAQAAILRSPYNKKVFINDPDALLVRDFQTEHRDDGVALTLDEAKTWTTVVAMSGGNILINEELERLSEERKALFTNILPPMGLAARPRDFYEYPRISEAFIRIDEDTVICAVYNFGDNKMSKTVSASGYVSGKAALVDCFEHEIIDITDGEVTFELKPHSSRAFLIKKLPENGGFLYSDGNFYLGAGNTVKLGKSYYYFSDGATEEYENVPCAKTKCLYIVKE